MPELSSWPTQNSGPTGTIDVREAATHIGALVFPHTSTLKSKRGFRPGPGASPGVVTATGTPDGFVHVAPFELLMQNIRGSGLGTYIAGLDAIKDINILSTPADPTNPRDDLIVAQQSDTFDSDANSDFLVRHVVGTPAPVPADPAVSGSTNFVTLARVRVNALATTITSGNITDLRTSGHANSLVGGLYSVALGGILPVASAAERDALTGLYNGLRIWRSDLKREEAYDGAVWTPLTGNLFTAYGSDTTSLTATTTNPTKGNSTYDFAYQQAGGSGGKLIVARFRVVIGSTFAAGSGSYRWLLPVAASTGAIDSSVGVCRLTDNGVAIYVGAVTLADSTHADIVKHGDANSLGSGGPGTAWATGDAVFGSITYEAA